MAMSFEDYSKERKELQKRGLLPEWYSTQAWQMFKSKYAVEGEEAVKGRFKTIAYTLSRYMTGQEDKWNDVFFDLMWKGWLSPSTPVLSNTGTTRGLNVSCSGTYIGDNVDSFYSVLRENALLSKYGFGCSADFSDIRPRGSSISVGGKASGVVPVIEMYKYMAENVSQGSQRRGAIACYLDIEHGDFDELADKLLHEPDGLNVGWTVRDSFIERLQNDDEEAQERFTRALYIKLVTGRGYFFKADEANRCRPLMYKDLNLDVKASNLCSEIMLHSSEHLTYTCVLSSMNLAKWDEWKNTDAVFNATVFLDCVVSDFLAKSAHLPGTEKAREFTRKGRAIGLGVLGWATYLQRNRIPYSSIEATLMNIDFSKMLHDESLRASQWLAQEFGEPEWCRGYGVRNTHRTAFAPTKSTSILMGGVSESVFPDPGMVYESGSAAGGMRRIVSPLYELMVERGVYNKETIDRIVNNLGSVQQEDWMTPEEKDVFLTAFETDQFAILRYASSRQKYICQGQSLNFFVSEDGDEERIAALHTKAFLDPNILSLYYIYSRSGVIVNSSCTSCEA